MDWILLVLLLVIFGGGFWVMGRPDRFAAQCVRQTRRETKAQAASSAGTGTAGGRMRCWMRSAQLLCKQHEDARLTRGMAPRGRMPGKGSIYRKCYGQGRVCRRFRRWSSPRFSGAESGSVWSFLRHRGTINLRITGGEKQHGTTAAQAPAAYFGPPFFLAVQCKDRAYRCRDGAGIWRRVHSTVCPHSGRMPAFRGR